MPAGPPPAMQHWTRIGVGMPLIYARALACQRPHAVRSRSLQPYSPAARLDKIRDIQVRGPQRRNGRESMQFIEGGCLCSGIRFRIAGEPIYSSICHCATCRRASAAPTVAWLTFDRGQVEMLSGSPLSYRSSQGVVRRFCGTCGTQLSYESMDSPSTIDITTASMDNPNLFPPTLEVWLEHRVSWQSANQTRSQYPRSTQ